ncbi:MAG TPA: DUF2306 domain-containing protein [Terriglobales bacterium]|nr:DUF2306 domain-containing protein [Terriglobales bacterium]
MATISVPLERAVRFRWKSVVFTLIALMMVYVLFHNERFLIDSKDPVWNHYHPFKWWLLPHGLAGACALLLGPMQFSDRLRQRFIGLHRVIGRIYVAGALIAAPLGFYIQYFEERMGEPRSFSVAAAVDAILWGTTTAIALSFALRRKIQLHRQWMTRSYAVAIVFLEVRVILGLTGWEKLGTAAAETVVWVCVACAIPLADIVLQWQDFRRSRALETKGRLTAVAKT